MNYSFEKIGSKSEELAPNEAEKTQEEFDAEVEREAEKLNTSVAELMKEIDTLGGHEKFKEAMEAKGDWGNENVAGKILRKESEKAESLDHLKGMLTMTAVLATVTTAAEKLAEYDLGSKLGEIVERMQSGIATEHEYIAMAPAALLGMLTMASGIKALIDNIKFRNQERKIGKDNLKLKIAGVDTVEA